MFSASSTKDISSAGLLRDGKMRAGIFPSTGMRGIAGCVDEALHKTGAEGTEDDDIRFLDRVELENETCRLLRV
jgi:hypothetical protein